MAALNEALQDEYRARALYRAVIDKFGAVHPFINIVEAENRHAEALLSLYAKYAQPAPKDDWPSRVVAPDSLEQACRDGVAAEVENAAMYDRLIAVVSEPDIIAVFNRLHAASQENHLPAFRRCVAREAGGDVRPTGPGGRRHRHRGGQA